MLIALLLLAAAPETEIRTLLDKQAADWSRGDIDGFMRGYEESPATTMMGREVLRGHAAILESYKRRYPGPERMGKLRFDELEVRMLGKDAALVTGRFNLTRAESAGGAATGRFTLVLRRTKAGWRIIHDQTS